MLQSLHRWQHRLLHALFGLPEDAEPLQARHSGLPNRPFKNHPLDGRHQPAHAPRILKRWQISIGTFIDRHSAKKRSG